MILILVVVLHLLCTVGAVLEKDVLLDFKAKITSDPFGVLSNWTQDGADVCTHWSGVICDNETRHVVSLALPSKYLLGSISPKLSHLTFLKTIDLSDNQLSGELPPYLGELPGLEELNLGWNALTGAIPQFLGKLRSLILLFNQLHGSIPPHLANCSNLQELWLGNNGLSGSIPAQFATLQHLEELELESANLSGGIPTFLKNCSALKELWLGGNPLLEGTIPEEIGQFHNLEALTLDAQTSLRGSIPPEIGNCSRLHWFFLNGEGNMGGPLPSSLSRLPLDTLVLLGYNINSSVEVLFNLTQLTRLYLEETNIRGSIPRGISKLKKLTFLALGSNRLSGIIPEELGKLASLEYLYLINNRGLHGRIGNLSHLLELHLDNCNFSGPLHPLGNLSLEFFSASGNALQGTIPSSLGNLKNLWAFDVSNNYLHGTLPESLQNCTQLESLDIGFNSFKGRLELHPFAGLQVISTPRNSFHGEFPVLNTSNPEALQLVDIRGNRFKGQLPSYLSKFKKVRVLVLASNNFFGPLPNWLWQMEELQVLDLSSNHFGGQLPTHALNGLNGFRAQVDRIPVYEDLLLPIKGNPGLMFPYVIKANTLIDLSSNHLSGGIPSSFGDLIGLRILNLSRNSFSGSIPGALGNMSPLEELDLSMNCLNGSIPSSLLRLNSLSAFNVSFNDLRGVIPTGPQFNTFSTSSFQGNPGLCGEPLAQCPSAVRQQNIVTGSKRWWQKLDEHASIPGIAVGFVLVFCTVMAYMLFY